MSLNLTMAAIIAFISAAIVLVLFFQKWSDYLKTKFPQDLALACTWLSVFLYSSAQGLAFQFLSLDLYRISYFIAAFVNIFLLIFNDYISKESIHPIRLTIITGLFIVALISSFLPNSIILDFYPNGELGIFQAGYFRILVNFPLVLTFIILIYSTSRLYLEAPQELKIYCGLYLFGMLLIVIGPIIFIILNLNLIFPAFHLFWMAISSVIIGITYSKEPRIGYILPFKVIKLSVIEINRGISLFNYNWSKKEELLEQATFSAMIHAINQFIGETLQKGYIREIILEKAILIVQKQEKYPIAFVLISTKSSKSLRKGLNCFIERFIKEYSEYFQIPHDTEKFKSASHIILDCFSFVPVY